jgi:hypothetical protein
MAVNTTVSWKIKGNAKRKEKKKENLDYKLKRI